MFESMFSLVTEVDSAKPSVSVAPEGETDDNPIRLQGDTSNEFRALLWALYALYVIAILLDHPSYFKR